MADKTIEGFIEAQDDWRGDAAREIDAIVREAAPQAVGSIKWAQPVYEQGGPFAFLKINKAHLTFGFWRGTELTDPDGILEGKGDRMKHVKFRSMADIDRDQIAAWVKEAVHLNEVEGDPTRRS
jgi:hypothetical protein